MARFCTNCGHELPEGKGFCPECGVPITEETPLPQGPEEGLPPPPAAPQPPRIEAEAPKRENPGAGAPPAAAPVYVAAAPPESPPVSTGGFFGLELLYKIPFVSFICSIVLSIAPKNKNVRHHAQAKLIWKIVGFVLMIVCLLLAGAVVRKAWDVFKDAFSQATGHEFSFDSLQDMDPSQLEDLQSILEQYGVGEIEGLDELQGLMEQYGVENIGDLEDMQVMLREYGIEDIGDLRDYLRENGVYEGPSGD